MYYNIAYKQFRNNRDDARMLIKSLDDQQVEGCDPNEWELSQNDIIATDKEIVHVRQDTFELIS